MRIYYAHPMSLYGTQQEVRDIFTLRQMNLEVVNPAAEHHAEAVKTIERSSDRMQYFINLLMTCDMVAFRAFPDGMIPCGVYLEVEHARNCGMPVIELPSGIRRRELDMESTIEYLHQVGQR